MDRITVTRPVIIKVRVTEKYKEELLRGLSIAIGEAAREIQRVDFKAKGMVTDKGDRLMVTGMEEIEKSRREKAEHKERLQRQYEAVAILHIGEEVVYGRTEGLVEVGIGDNVKCLSTVEVVVEEGRIVMIREQD